MSTAVVPPSSFPEEKMATDRRYQPSSMVDIPESLLHPADETSSFSIRGKFREGQAAYMDHSATTPIDPRVLDLMLPYMVRSPGRYLILVNSRSHSLLNRFSDRLATLATHILELTPLDGKRNMS
jgi:hypothetical protein